MSTPLASDADLWDRSLNGDERAFAGLFDRHKDRVFRHCFSRARSHSDADDLTAVVFFELWRHRYSIQLVDGSLLPWLLVTATHTARNADRARRRYLNMLAKLPHEISTHETAEDEALRIMPLDDVSPALAAALRDLPEKDEQLMILVAVEGLSTSAAAKACGLQPAAARSRLMRVKRRLAATLALPISALEGSL